jgi:cytoskeletal protein RodZ
MPHSTTLGSFLRGAREARGLSVDDVSGVTRVRSRHLRALEEERLGDLPAPVFVRGFIRAYCASVGLPPAEPLHLYEARLRAVRAAAPAVPAPAGRDRRRRPAVPALIAAALLLLGGALYLAAHSSAPGLSPGPSARVPPR